MSCQEIAKLNVGFDVGAIVKAKVDLSWDEQRQKYMEDLSDSVRQAAAKASLETIHFASDALSVFHKLAGQKFRRYLQTGNEAELGDFSKMGFKTYKDFVELLMKLTGQDINKKQVVGQVLHTHKMEQPKGEKVIDLKAITESNEPMSPEEASALLDHLEEKK